MYRFKSNKLKVKFVTSKQRMVFERYEIMVGPGDVLVSLDNKLCFVCSQEAFLRVAEVIVPEKKFKKVERKKKGRSAPFEAESNLSKNNSLGGRID